MAVTLTAAELATAIRTGTSTEELAQATRLLATATAALEKFVGGDDVAPDAIMTEAIIRYAGYLNDMPNAPRGGGYADVIRNSGAGELLAQWRVIDAGEIAE